MAVYKDKSTNTWRVVYRYTDYTGESKQSQKRGFATKREAVAWERENTNKLETKLDMTFASFVEVYTRDMNSRVKENTWRTKEHIIETKILPYFKKRKICEILPKDILAWQTKMLNEKDQKGKLKEFADCHSICVLTVHHTRKQPAGDSFDMISGTTGLLGCADGAFLMKKELRTGTEATIDVVGRDQQDQILYLKKDMVTQIWSLTKAANAPAKAPPDPVLEVIAQYVSVNQPQWSGTATELANAVSVGLAANALSKYLNVKSGKLLNDYSIRYERKTTHTERRIILTYIGSGATAATVATVPGTPSF